MRSLLVLLALLVGGCSTDSFVAHPLGGGQYLVQRSLSNPHAWAATPQTNWIEACSGRERHVVANGKPTIDDIELFDCRREGSFWYTQQTGYVSGLLAPALQAGGMVGAGALIGDGLKHSGSTNNTNNNLQGGSQSQSMSQGQSQRHH